MKNLIAILVLCVVFLSCKKYEDGPLVSLASKASRVANVWKVESANDLNEADSTALFRLHKWELTPNYSIIYSINQKKYFGRWQFTQNNENLEFTFDSLPTKTYVIKKLLNNEMSLKDRSTDITINFIPAN